MTQDHPMMTTPTPAVEGLDRLESAARAATPGPWTYDEVMEPFYNDTDGNSCGGGGAGVAEIGQEDGAGNWLFDDEGEPVMVPVYSLKNAAFIAAFNPATALSLISALRASEAERGHWKGLADEHALFDAETDLAFKDLDHQIADLEARATAAEAERDTAYAMAKGWKKQFDAQAETIGELVGVLRDAQQFIRNYHGPAEVEWVQELGEGWEDAEVEAIHARAAALVSSVAALTTLKGF